ncbi:glutamine amidotransferase class-II [Thioalkalivibrio sulfidiphilus HL-EbGr7]|uniref:Glutamine amidotransferase class-II n=1 Tax=Thioalkalivibrio sulfidiphilus (strain HL-EbGR7) TaxID=396588 RepID=B8GS78_THISH|nr:glutamine amidotransferase [Thioalkalivibrio sulfidiphilus]ACL72782.1 glutamine amidotransferase class-II [Thioalkalivibrio sulfidiphilus HL-EbGr7]
MCGIVGLLLKNPSLNGQLGQLVTPMLESMSERGPDSAGLAVFADTDRGEKYSLFAQDADFDWDALERALDEALVPTPRIEAQGRYARLYLAADPDTVRPWFAEHFPALHILSAGHFIDIYKDAGHPAAIAERYGFPALTGSHAIGHTRMATESAITPAHAHPFTAGEDFCLVHNGSLSNPYKIRRQLERKGIRFETDNDTEAACRFLEWRLRDGDSLEDALSQGFNVLDGFYTLLMGTHDKLALVRDPFACKPAVVAETDDYVAIGSEYRALAHLPGVKEAMLFEPKPEEIYSWTR